MTTDPFNKHMNLFGLNKNQRFIREHIIFICKNKKTKPSQNKFLGTMAVDSFCINLTSGFQTNRHVLFVKKKITSTFIHIDCIKTRVV